MTEPTTDIRSHIANHYATAIRAIAADSEAVAGSCCGGGACGSESATSDATSSSCCGDDGCGTQAAAPLYAAGEVASLPDSVTDVSFGCGNPTGLASLRPGETVLDLGSGGGIDCFFAGEQVGPEGRVFGVDMTPEMIALARGNATKVGATIVEFRLGEIEHLPLPDESVDVVISNCVINLSPEKEQVFREAFRVLRPGGRLQVSDIVLAGAAPDPAPAVDAESWAGCVAGALPEAEYAAGLTAAGFVEVTVATPAVASTGPVSADVMARKR